MTSTPPPPPPEQHPWQPPAAPQGQVPGGDQPPTAYPQQPGVSVGYAYPPAPVKPPALPAEPTEYHLLLRGPRRAWWRPLVSLLIVLAGFIVASLVLLVGMTIGWLLMGEDLGEFADLSLDGNNPVTFAGQNLFLAALIPITGLATWVAHGVRPGFLSSVVGRFRWGWFGWCLLVIVPLWIGYIIIGGLIVGDSGAAEATGSRPPTWLPLLILTLLTTPLQSAGEEYLFRGWLMQQVGAYVKNTYAALVIAIVLSVVLFGLAHSSLDPWVLIELGAIATAAVLLTWRTGGLEAAVVLHLVNNVIVLSAAILTTGLSDTFITPETTSTPVAALTTIVANALVTAAVFWLARKRGVAR
ncbi:MAG TPA: CPBP family intramembrane metalloprotease, partial [Intrasporangiaceae bacterium]|nr:CPBP family intramembrane metalloprotease [Intrasporangiaceae bacterium]